MMLTYGRLPTPIKVQGKRKKGNAEQTYCMFYNSDGNFSASSSLLCFILSESVLTFTIPIFLPYFSCDAGSTKLNTGL